MRQCLQFIYYFLNFLVYNYVETIIFGIEDQIKRVFIHICSFYSHKFSMKNEYVIVGG